jgi:hypothetical protein
MPWPGDPRKQATSIVEYDIGDIPSDKCMRRKVMSHFDQTLSTNLNSVLLIQ